MDDVFSSKRSRDEDGKSVFLQQSTASRIYRVARASGGKDRHSKVMTAKGLRDRRVRLSVPTAIQFYDLQDRLGYDQPSKAIEWLIKAAATAISELPSLDAVFEQLKPDHEEPNRERADDDDAVSFSRVQFSGRELQQQQHFSLARSNGSSTSETSKSSVLSKAKDKETATPQSSFTELLNGHLTSADFHFRKQLGDHHFAEQLVPYGLNRGTLQSNSPSPVLHQHLQRFSSPGSGSNLPLFLGGTVAAQSSAAAVGQLPAGFDSRLQLCYLGYRNSDLEDKGKS